MKLYLTIVLVIMVCFFIGPEMIIAQTDDILPALPDLVVENISLDTQCNIVITLNNKGGYAKGNEHAESMVKVIYGNESEDFYLGALSTKGKAAVDPQKNLIKWNVAVTYTTAITLTTKQTVTVEVNSNGNINESNRRNNKMSKELEPHCMVMLDKTHIKIVPIARQGWCCSNSELVESNSTECSNKGGTFYADHRAGLSFCTAKVQEAPAKGWCCINGELSELSHKACQEQGGQFFEDQATAQSSCRPPIQEQPQRQREGWCCINGELSELSHKACQEQGGQFFEDQETAQNSCRPPIQEQPQTPREGWCCINGELPQMNREACQEQGGQFFEVQATAQDSCRPPIQEQPQAPPKGWCCINGELVPMMREQCEAERAPYFESRERAERSCRKEAPQQQQQGWCCINGEILPMFEDACIARRGRHFKDREPAEIECRGVQPKAMPEGWCCSNKTVIQATQKACEEFGGQFFASQENARTSCASQEITPTREGFCCVHGSLRGASRQACEERGGVYYSERDTAREQCRREEKEQQPPQEQLQPAQGWCCINGQVQQIAPEKCTQSGGTYFSEQESAQASCMPPMKKISGFGWCCLNGTILISLQNACEEKKGKYFEDQEDAQKSCSTGSEELPYEGWCCTNGKLAKGSSYACDVRAGRFFRNGEDAQMNCQKPWRVEGWCCKNNAFMKSTADACKDDNGTFFTSYTEARSKCVQEGAVPIEIDTVMAMPEMTKLLFKPPYIIEDVSPGAGSTTSDSVNDSIFGRILALVGSGKEKMKGSASSWTYPAEAKAKNESMEHLALRSANDELFFFMFYTTYDWQAFNLTGRTGYKIAGTPVGWTQSKSGWFWDEYIAAAGTDGSLLVFSMSIGSEWKVENVSTKTGYKIKGDLTWWSSLLGSEAVNHVAAQSTDGDLVVFYQQGKSAWQVKNVSAKTGKKIAGAATSWKTANGTTTVEHLAAPDSNGDLLVFYWQWDQDWKVVNVSSITGQRVSGTATSWQTPNGAKNVEHLAAQSPGGELLVFYWEPGSDWKVINVTTITGQKIEGAVTSWKTTNGDQIVEHLAAKGTDSNLYTFYWQPGVDWKVINVTSKTGQKVASAATSWISYNGSQPVEHLAATDSKGDLFVFYWMPWTDWQVVNVSVKASNRVQYAATHLAGVWRSNDYGNNWGQLTRPQPAENEKTTGSLNTPIVLDVAVSPEDLNIVLAAAIDDARTSPKTGIYRSTDGGKSWSMVYQPKYSDGTVAKVTQIRFAPDDNKLVYAAVGSGIAISTDSGAKWTESKISGTGPYSLHAWHIAIAPKESSSKRRLYACGNGHLWYSINDGSTWSEEYALTKQKGLETNSNLLCQETTDSNGTAAQIMDVEPGHPDRLYIAYKHLANGPRYFAQHDDLDKKSVVLTEMDGVECGTYVTLTSDHQKKIGETQLLVGCGEGSIWYGDFSGFKDGSTSTQRASWEKMTGPPVYWGGSTPSGRAYLKIHPVSGGYLLFFSDRSHVHMSVGKPAKDSWHRLDGLDIAKTRKDNKGLYNRLVMHVDPHAILVSPDYNLSLKKPSGVDSTYSKNYELDKCYAGRIWLGNDGGIYLSRNCGTAWEQPYAGPKTLIPVNIAGIASPGKAPALYMGTGDNDDFYTLDGGKTWKPAWGSCGDCGHWFADPVLYSRVMEIGAAERKGQNLFIYTNASASYADTLDEKNRKDVGYFDDFRFPIIDGARPLILTVPPTGSWEIVSKYGDYIAIAKAGTDLHLLRVKVGWGVFGFSFWWSVGLKLPCNCSVYQASGGPDSPTYFVGDYSSLWKSSLDSKKEVNKWTAIVPGTNAQIARRFFVNPYNPKNIYIIDTNSIKRSDDGGTIWVSDTSLQNQLTSGGEYSFNCSGGRCILTDMVFNRNNPLQRFAVGVAGAFTTSDGKNWTRLMDTNALPCRPVTAYFNGITDSNQKELYIACDGRGVLKIYPLP